MISKLFRVYLQTGADCSIPDSKGVWYHVDAFNAPLPRASHKSAVDEDYMYVVNGEVFKGPTSKTVSSKVSRYRPLNLLIQ